MTAATAPWTATSALHLECVICDAEPVLMAARARGWPCVRSIAEAVDAAGRPAWCLLIATSTETLHDPGLRTFLATTRTLYLGLQAFDPSPSAAAYTLEMLARSDLGAAVRRNRRWVRIIERRRELLFRSGSTPALLSCIPADAIEAGTCVSLALAPGSLVSVGALCEVELERFAEPDPPFVVNGELIVDGALFALADDFAGDRAAARACGEEVFAAAQQRPLSLSIRDNRLIACRDAQGRSLLPELAAAVDGRLWLTEFAIGTNRLRRPNFAINAQINEGAGGIHVGLGGGEHGLHLDFVARSARLVQEAACPARLA